MKRQGLKLIVVSTAGLDEVLSLIWAAGVPDLLDDALTGNDLLHEGDADESIIEVAARRYAPDRGSAIFLGDTPYDVETGRTAGIGVVALRCGGWADASLVGAAAVYRDPRELLSNYSMSPFNRLGVAASSMSLPGSADMPAGI
jgi:phosphoglycolate phosphatase-like HAD superfamily hydrolase